MAPIFAVYAKTREQPSLTLPPPYKPTQYASHNSSEASTTTINSPPDTNNGSPHKTRFDKHRSIGTVQVCPLSTEQFWHSTTKGHRSTSSTKWWYATFVESGYLNWWYD